MRPNKHSPVAECLTTANRRTPGLSARRRYHGLRATSAPTETLARLMILPPQVGPSFHKGFFFILILYIYSSSKQAGDGTERESTHERESNFKKGNVMD